MRHFHYYIFTIALLALSTISTQAQYANGTGTGLHQNNIFWLRWDESSLLSKPDGFSSTNIVAGTYIWELEPGVTRVVGQLVNIETPTLPNRGALTLAPYKSGSYIEVYVTSAAQVKNPSKWVTELYVPVGQSAPTEAVTTPAVSGTSVKTTTSATNTTKTVTPAKPVVKENQVIE